MITVGVCTLNRSHRLPEVLGRLGDQVLVDDVFELIVVDNGSTDDTHAVLDGLTSTIPNLRWLVEPRKGQSFARNTLIAEAAGDLIVFTDDDVHASPGWLQSLVDPLRARGEVAATGGRVDLALPRARPSWLDDDLAVYLAQRDYGTEPIVMGQGQSPVGASMAIRTEVLRDVGGFRTELGHVGRYPVGCEEYELFLRILEGGHQLFYVPEPVMLHQIPPERLTRRYMGFRMFCDGIGRSKMRMLDGRSIPTTVVLRDVFSGLRQIFLTHKRGVIARTVTERSSVPAVLEWMRICFEAGKLFGLFAGRRR